MLCIGRAVMNQTDRKERNDTLSVVGEGVDFKRKERRR